MTENDQLQIDFEKLLKVRTEKVIPVVVQNSKNKAVLIVAYVNDMALKKSMELKQAVFWSTSRNELWIKGSTSGDYLALDEIRVNCEQNSLLFLVTPQTNGACHVKDKQGNAYSTCFFRRVNTTDYSLNLINDGS